jgi:hypothetical protein
MTLGHSVRDSMVPRWDHVFAYLEEFLLVASGIHQKGQLLVFLAFEVRLQIEDNQVVAYPLSLENMHQEVRHKALKFVAVEAGLDRVAGIFVVVVVHLLKVEKSHRVSESNHHRW